jgi:ABC-2 type transport system permease protein
MIAALVAVPLIVGVANYIQDQAPRHGRFDRNLFTELTSNGVNFAIFNLLVMSSFFLVVVVAAFAGESVSGEATWGTLRYLLVRPVGRVKLILSKLLIAAVLALASTGLVVIVALLFGTVLFGWKDATLVSNNFPFLQTVSAWNGVARLAVSSLYFTACLMFVVALGMFLSTLTDSTAAAVVGTIVIVVTCGVLLQVPSLEGIRPIVPTKYWAEWQNLFQPGQPVASEMIKGLISTAVYTTIFSVLAVMRFQRKDILS